MTPEAREQRIQAVMETLGMDHDEAALVVAIEEGETEGDLVDLDGEGDLPE